MPSKYAYCAEALKPMFETPWKLKAPAFRVFGNLYFVGNRDGASWLADTREGLLLFDSNYPTAAALLLDSIWSLGFDPRRIRAIFHTHGHFDHFGATALLRDLSGAQTYLGRADADMFGQRGELALIGDSQNAYLELFTPDVAVEDGDTFHFGATTVRAVSCPGHSQGATSYFFNVTDGKTELTAGLHGGAGLNTLCRDFRRRFGVDWRADFEASLEKVMDEPVDIFLGNHTGQNDAMRKLSLLTAQSNPFVDKNAWRSFLTELRRRYQEMLSQEAGEERA